MVKQSKKVLLTGVASLSAFGVFAQGNGSAGITEATQMVTSYFAPATQLIYAIGSQGRVNRWRKGVQQI